SLPDVKYANDRDIRRYAAEVERGLARLPGTQSVAVGLTRPLSSHNMHVGFRIDGQPEDYSDKRPTADVRPVSVDFFRALGIRRVRGRLCTAAEENFGPPPVLVVSETFAKRFFPTSDPIGQRIIIGISHDTATSNSSVTSQGEIVGIVKDVHQRGLND